ncbi:MAG: hypothetical protein R3362_07660 [Rhodothermales bacterium]|nr:hypothetical protein [Rhodothermales bacterium]
MPLSIRETAVRALKSAIEGVAGVTAYRGLDVALGPGDLPAAVLIEGADDADTESSFGTVLHTLALDVEVIVDGDASEANLQALEDLRAKIVAAVTGPGSPSGETVVEAGAAAPDVSPRTGHAPSAAVVQSFIVTYATREGDPYTVS